MQLSNFLRIILKIDAASCLGMAALILPLAGGLQGALGVPLSMLISAAISLIPIGLFILWLGFRRAAAPALLWLVILGNIGWAAGSLLVAAELPGITPLGRNMVAGQGMAVLLLAAAEWVGLRHYARLAQA